MWLKGSTCGTLCWAPRACCSECDPGPGPQAPGQTGTGRLCSSPAGPWRQSPESSQKQGLGPGQRTSLHGNGPKRRPAGRTLSGRGCTQTFPVAGVPSAIGKQTQALPLVPSHRVRGLGLGPSEPASPPPSKSIYPLGLGVQETGHHPSSSDHLKHLTNKSQRLHLQQT